MFKKTAERYTAHGWTTHRMRMPAGGRYSLLVSREAVHADLPIVAFYTRGHIAATNLRTGNQVMPRTPGVLTQGLGRIHEGQHEFHAVEDSEWWCFDKRTNGGQLPQMQVLQLEQGSPMTLEPGTLGMLCAGLATADGTQLVPGDCFSSSEAFELRAAEGALALVFDRASR